MSVTVDPVRTAADLDAFIRLPWRLYAGNPCWTPPLLRLQREALSPRHNPFYAHADVQLFLAREGARVVGRISAQVDHEHNRVHRERTGFFGFFECENSEAQAGALLATAEHWLRQRGMREIRGPASFSLNSECGLLVQGFDSPPVVLMPYNPPFYATLLERQGYAKLKDLYAWRYDWDEMPDRAKRVVESLRRLPEVRVRPIDMSRLPAEMAAILDVVNSAWSENWGFVPLTEQEARKFVDDFRLIADPDIVPVVEIDGRPAAVAVCLPNLNEAIHDLNGRLLPFGWLRLLWRLKVRGVSSLRLLLLGVRKEYRVRRYAGLPYLLCDEIHRRGTRRYRWAEFSWTLEDNGLINAMIRNVCSDHYKTYRIYGKELAS
jgi:hypothetical protein